MPFPLLILFIVLFSLTSYGQESYHGALIRGNVAHKQIALVFTGHEYAEGGRFILKTLEEEHVPGSFFLTGAFYQNNKFEDLIVEIKQKGHYLGAHSDQHLLYCDWENREKLLVTKEEFTTDLLSNYKRMAHFDISRKEASFFLPPYEWYNSTIAEWTKAMGIQLINYTSGTKSHADYTTPEMSNYHTSKAILQSIYDFEESSKHGLNGFVLLMHVGAGPKRSDKFFNYLPELIQYLKAKGYKWVTLNALFPQQNDKDHDNQ